ncbi:hydrogenase maturation protease [Streptomyces sp. LP05-1]|uniref:Hydrogenase maturation protease n=1 Tax=Streptomyces pyxinae TaxID=2970734 RepID=A0ABT2CQB6_9ACTN|nr:hydrogenase maturation protease [Streptomyces sp. LP05-1]MCS0639510.1 hydrogenase maturation protease [Streptomyces sp. LP05-1]
MTTPRDRAVSDLPGRTLVAGVGNIFLGDDGFGVETVQRLARLPAPAGVGAMGDVGAIEYMDVGIRGVHLAYRLLEGYRHLVLVDALARGAEPGTLCVLDATEEVTGEAPDSPAGPAGPAVDAHALDPAAVLRLIRGLHRSLGAAAPAEVHVVGCEPRDTDEAIGLSPPVAAAVPRAMELVTRLTTGCGVRTTEPAGRSRMD